MNRCKQNSIKFIINNSDSMVSQNLRIGLLITFVIAFLIIFFHIITSITQEQNAKIVSKHALDAVFLPNPESTDLRMKINQLTIRLNNLKNGSACTDSSGQVCEHLKSNYNELMREVGISYQKKVSERLIYQTRWNTTCQEWKGESERFLDITIDLANELKNISIKIQKLANQKSQLQAQKKQRSSCPEPQACRICPQDDTKECPDEVPCAQCDEEDCPVCKDCQECLQCFHHDINQLKHQFEVLTLKMEQCREQVVEYQNNPIKPEECADIHYQLKQSLIIGLKALSSLEKVTLVSTNLKQVIVKSEQQLSISKSVQDSLSIVPLIINGLSKEIKDLEAKSKQEVEEKECKQCGGSYDKILQECMDAFKKTIDKLTSCQTLLSPFLASNKQ